MKVYAVITSGEVNGYIEGSFLKKEKAVDFMNEIIADWKKYIRHNEDDIEADEDYFSIYDLNDDITYEAKIVEMDVTK